MNSMPPWEIFPAFLLSADFFSKSTFSKNSFRNTIRVSNRFDQWVQSVCKNYQQTPLGDKELKWLLSLTVFQKSTVLIANFNYPRCGNVQAFKSPSTKK